MIESARLRTEARTTVSITRIAVAVGIILLVGIAHFHISREAYEITGPLAIVDRVFDILLAGCLLTVVFCTGRGIARVIGLTFLSTAEEASLSVMLGTGTIGMAVLGLGLAGILRPLPVGLLLLGSVLATHRELRVALATVKRCFELARAATGTRLIGIAFLALVVVMALRTLLPPTSPDEAIYHLSVAKSFVGRCGLFPVYDNFSGNMPFLPQMIYAICLMAKSDIAAKLFSLILAITSSIAIYGFCARFLDRRTAIISLFAFFGAGMVVEVAVTARVDVSLAGMLFVAIYAMMVYLDTGERGWFLASAMLCGFALGIKYSAAAGLALILFMLTFDNAFRKRQRILSVCKRALSYAAIAIAVASPWYVKNLIWFHNPIYPFVTGETASTGSGKLTYFTAADERRIDAYYDAALREIPEDVELMKQQLSELASERPERHPFRFWEYFTSPTRYHMNDFYHDPNYLFLLSPLFLVFSRARWMIWIGFFAVGFFVFSAMTSWLARYLLPAYPVLTILAAYTLSEITRRLSFRTKLAGMLPAVVVGLAVGSALFVCATQIYDSGGFSFLTGAISRQAFMYSTPYFPPLDYINRELPADSRLLMLGAQMGYDLKRDYIADGGWDAIEWKRVLVHSDSLENVNEALKDRGVTHILLFPGMFRFVALLGREGSGPSGSQFQGVKHSKLWRGLGWGSSEDPGGPPRPDYQGQLENWAIFDLYARGFLELIYKDRVGFQLYRIK
jgi:4-amino-4-deoxy-L-arabinose transferase-like glycosyltransferase